MCAELNQVIYEICATLDATVVQWACTRAHQRWMPECAQFASEWDACRKRWMEPEGSRFMQYLKATRVEHPLAIKDIPGGTPAGHKTRDARQAGAACADPLCADHRHLSGSTSSTASSTSSAASSTSSAASSTVPATTATTTSLGISPHNLPIYMATLVTLLFAEPRLFTYTHAHSSDSHSTHAVTQHKHAFVLQSSMLLLLQCKVSFLPFTLEVYSIPPPHLLFSSFSNNIYIISSQNMIISYQLIMIN